MKFSWKSMLASLLAILLVFSPIGTFNTFAVEDESATFTELTVNDQVVNWGELAINDQVVDWSFNGEWPEKLADEEGLGGLSYYDEEKLDFTLTHELSGLKPGTYRVSVKTHNDELGSESGSEMFVKTNIGEYEKAITSMGSSYETPSTLTLGAIEVGEEGNATIGFTIKADSKHYGYLKDIEFVSENEMVPKLTTYKNLTVNDKPVGWLLTGERLVKLDDEDVSGGLGYWDSTGMDFTLTHELSGLEPGTYRVSAKTYSEKSAPGNGSEMFVRTTDGEYGKEITLMDDSSWAVPATLALDGIVVGADGNATIGFTIKADSEHYGYLKDIEFVNEAAPTISALKLSPNSMNLRPGKSLTIMHQGQGIPQYKSSNEQVATVDTAGIVTAVGDGSAVITATIEVEEGVMLVGQTAVFVSGSLQTELNNSPLFVKPIPELQGNKRDEFIMGTDISTVLEIEDLGRKYYDLQGQEKPLMEVLKDNGVNWIRLRIWNDPKDENGNWYGAGNTNKEKVIEMAKQAKEHDLKVLVDFHYSDFWADPARQTIPKEWANLSEAGLEKAVYDYTHDVIKSLDAVGAYPDMVQIGNEINSGMLWPKGKTPKGAKKYIEAGISAVRKAEKDLAGEKIKVLIHRADPQDGLEKLTEFYEVYKDLDYDVIGLSYYPFYHGTIDNIKTVMDSLADEFKKEIVIAETSYAYTLEDPINNGPTGHTFNEGSAVNGGYLPTVTGQTTVIRDVIAAVAEVPGDKGLGVFYWEPAWLPGTDTGWGTTYAAEYQGETISEDGGSGWSNQALFNYFGEALPSIKVFNLVRGEGMDYIEPNLIKVNEIQVTTNEGINVPLPMAIKGLFTDGAYRNVAVKSWTPSEYNYNSAGTYTAKASLQEGQSATATITVRPRNYVRNADIESDDLSDWTLNGVTRTSDASFNGQYSLNFWDKALVEAGQKITGLPKGIYQLSVQTRIGLEKPIAASSHMYALTSKERKEVKLYATGWDRWANMVIEGIEVTDGTLEIGVMIKDAKEAYGNFDEWQLIRIVDLETEVEPVKPGTGNGNGNGNGSNPDSGNSSIPDSMNGQNPEDETVITPKLELDVNGIIALKLKENQQLNLSLNQLKQLAKADKIEVAYGAMTIQITIDQLLSFTSEAGADGYVSIAIKELNSSLTKYQSAGNVDLTTVGKPFSIELKPLNALGQGVAPIKALPVTVALQWKIEEGPSNHLTGLYQLGDKLRYVGGHAEGNSFTANVDQLDNLSLLIYDKAFSDVSSEYWASDYVKELVAKGIIVGKSDGVFDPTGTITRAEYIALIVRTLGIENQQSQQVFTDVNSNSWYASYVSAAYQAGIVNGKGDEKFAPGERITRQEMAVMLVRAYELKSGISPTSDSDNKQLFTDMKTIQPWAADAVSKAGALGFIHGKNDNKFEPNALTTRAEAAKVIVSLRNQLYKTTK